MSSVATGQSILWQSRKPNATTTATTTTATTATSRYEHQINIKPRSLADLGLWVSQCHISRIYSYELRVLSAAVNAIATRYSRHASCLNHFPFPTHPVALIYSLPSPPFHHPLRVILIVFRQLLANTWTPFSIYGTLFGQGFA